MQGVTLGLLRMVHANNVVQKDFLKLTTLTPLKRRLTLHHTLRAHVPTVSTKSWQNVRCFVASATESRPLNFTTTAHSQSWFMAGFQCTSAGAGANHARKPTEPTTASISTAQRGAHIQSDECS
jgi:hypothetical protein